ncbi:hypothetical protein T4A_7678, partial [Trichinella pseudospiralis]
LVAVGTCPPSSPAPLSPPAKPCPGVSPRRRRLQAPVPAVTIFSEMTLSGSGNPIHPRRIGHPDPPKTQPPHQMAALLRECKFTPTLPCLLHIQIA